MRTGITSGRYWVTWNRRSHFLLMETFYISVWVVVKWLQTYKFHWVSCLRFVYYTYAIFNFKVKLFKNEIKRKDFLKRNKGKGKERRKIKNFQVFLFQVFLLSSNYLNADAKVDKLGKPPSALKIFFFWLIFVCYLFHIDI